MLLSREKLLLQINDKDKITILRRLIDLMEISIRDNTVQFSDFLDPYERKLAMQIARKISILTVSEFPIDLEMERKILVFYGEYIRKYQYPVEVFKIQSKYSNLDHSKILGSVLGLGINREKIGDISTLGKYAYIVVKKEVSGLISISLKKIGKESIIINPVSLDEYEDNSQCWDEFWTTVPSMRLDAIISEILKIPRAKAKQLILQGFIKVDFRTANRPHEEVNSGLISVRGYGRFKLFDDFIITKKGRIRIRFGSPRKM